MTALATSPALVEDRAATESSTSSGHQRASRPTVAALVGLMVTVAGAATGLAPLHDNSFFTHLATGRLILEGGGVPSNDPYSFTALGRPWVVQSWFASLIYGAVDAVAGVGGLRLLMAFSTGALAYLVWRMTRPAGSLLGRLVVAVLGLGVGVGTWSERPLLFGLVGMALLLLAADGQFDARWMIPVMWVWVNTHGSFPLAVVVLALLAAGRRLDGERPRTELRVLGWTVAGIALGGLNPIGPRLLLFPMELLRHTESFKAIVEWQPPRFDEVGQQVFLLQLVVALVLLNRRRRWRTALPTLVFAVLAFSAARNVAPASIVLVAVMAAGAAGIGRVDGDRRPRWARSAVAVIAGFGLLLGAARLTGPGTDLSGYPTGSLAWLKQEGMIGQGHDARLVSRDFVGNLLEARDGADANVFIDDRVDMYPPAVVEDYVTLVRGRAGWQRVLVRYRADVVLWDTDSDLGRQLARSPDWRVVHEEKGWIVLVPADRPRR